MTVQQELLKADLATGGAARGPRSRGKLSWIAPAAAALVLLSMKGWELSMPDAAAGTAYMTQVRAQLMDFPETTGDWKGVDTPLPPEAIAALHANFSICRHYVNQKTGDDATMMFIQVEDSRDMMGHYPPNCYPGNGWVEIPDTRAVHDGAPGHLAMWEVDGLKIPGVEYFFKRQENGSEQTKTVRNFFMLPSGQYFPEMDSFWRPAMSFANRPFGAAEIQVCFDREYLLEDRDRMFDSLIRAHMPLIKAVTTRN